MADEIAALGAPAEAAPSGVADSSTAVSAPEATQTDEEILGLDPIGTSLKDEPKPVIAEEKPADQTAVKTPEQIAAEQAAGDARTIPHKWQELAKSDPEFRTLFFTAKTNAEKLATIEPQFTEAQAKVAAIDKTDAAYFSGDPGIIAGELKTFLGEKPAAILPMLTAGENLLKELLPKEYARINSERLTSSLKEVGMDKALTFLRTALEAGDAGVKGLQEQVAKILEYFDGNGMPTTEAARLAQQKSQLDSREQSAREADEQSYVSTSQTFRTTINKEVETAFTTEIKTATDKILEKSAFPEGARTRISADVKAKLYEKLGQSKETIEMVNRAIWPGGKKDAQGKDIRGQWNDAARKVAIDAPIAYAKTILNDVIKEVVDAYTHDFIATTDNQQKKAAAAGARTEVSGGSSAARGSKPLSKKDIDYDKQSDDDILGL
jgi:hypothetical protein